MPGERFLNARYVHLSQRLTNVDVKSKCPDVFRSLPLFSQKKVLFSETPGIRGGSRCKSDGCQGYVAAKPP